MENIDFVANIHFMVTETVIMNVVCLELFALQCWFDAPFGIDESDSKVLES